MRTFLSSPERPVKHSGKVSWLRLIYSPRLPIRLYFRTVAVCGFRGLHSGGTAPESHRTSLGTQSCESNVGGTYNAR